MTYHAFLSHVRPLLALSVLLVAASGCTNTGFTPLGMTPEEASGPDIPSGPALVDGPVTGDGGSVAMTLGALPSSPALVDGAVTGERGFGDGAPGAAAPSGPMPDGGPVAMALEAAAPSAQQAQSVADSIKAWTEREEVGFNRLRDVGHAAAVPAGADTENYTVTVKCTGVNLRSCIRRIDPKRPEAYAQHTVIASRRRTQQDVQVQTEYFLSHAGTPGSIDVYVEGMGTDLLQDEDVAAVRNLQMEEETTPVTTHRGSARRKKHIALKKLRDVAHTEDAASFMQTWRTPTPMGGHSIFCAVHPLPKFISPALLKRTWYDSQQTRPQQEETIGALLKRNNDKVYHLWPLEQVRRVARLCRMLNKEKGARIVLDPTTLGPLFPRRAFQKMIKNEAYEQSLAAEGPASMPFAPSSPTAVASAPSPTEIGADSQTRNPKRPRRRAARSSSGGKGRRRPQTAKPDSPKRRRGASSSSLPSAA